MNGWMGKQKNGWVMMDDEWMDKWKDERMNEWINRNEDPHIGLVFVKVCLVV